MVHSSEHARNHSLLFATIIICGVAALSLGLALIFFAHYHERAYIFLALGAGGIIAGIAGLAGAASRLRMILSYGVIASGIMGFTIGLNYLADRYGPPANRTEATFVLVFSLAVILAGIAGTLSGHARKKITILSRVFTLGIIASLGVVAMTVGMVYLMVLHSQGHATLLLAAGAICFIGGLACDKLAHKKAGATSR